MTLPSNDRPDAPRAWLPVALALSVLILLLVWMTLTPAGLLGKADAIGYAVCHRIDERSFHLDDRAMPLCARCSGMYLGALVGLLFQGARGRLGGFAPRRVWVVLALFLVAFGIDGLNSYVHLIPLGLGVYEPQNWMRLLTGTGMGLGMAVAVFPAFHQSAWAEWRNEPAVRGLRDLGLMVLLGLVVAAMVYSENPLLLFPLALASSATVVLMLVMIYTLIWLMLLRRDNRNYTYRDLWLPALAALGMTILQIGGLDLIRFWLTGTWSGFVFG